MTSSLVGSEIFIRDRQRSAHIPTEKGCPERGFSPVKVIPIAVVPKIRDRVCTESSVLSIAFFARKDYNLAIDSNGAVGHLLTRSAVFVKVYLKTKKMTNISQAQAGFKANSRRNPLWISRLFNAKSGCVCRNRLNFRLFRYTQGISFYKRERMDHAPHRHT